MITDVPSTLSHFSHHKTLDPILKALAFVFKITLFFHSWENFFIVVCDAR